MTTENGNLHELQKYEIGRVHRSKINPAPYNPRWIPEQNRKDLKKNLSKMGLREALVWNKQTGNLVGGHQRLEQLDDYHKKKHKNLDYSLDIIIIDVSLKEEVEINISLNNNRLMGYYDLKKMNDLLSNPEFIDLDYDAIGIKDEDLNVFGITRDLENVASEEIEAAINDFEAVKEYKKDIPDEEKEARKQAVKQVKAEVKKNEVDTYVTLTFSTQDAKRAFMRSINEQEDSLYIKGEIFVKNYMNAV